ncbi:MAG TPA: cyclase family protein [Methylomirabilota bacterium]|nr:cyclase family protein [Methylomirabilota bacterium]
MRLIDLSQPLYDGAPNCPAHPPVRAEIIADHPKHGWRVELLTLASHTGSHVDAPSHKLADGPNLDQMPLETFVGEAIIADLRGAHPDQPFTSTTLSRVLRHAPVIEDKIILIATGWGDKRAQTDEWLRHSPYLSPDAAEWCVEQKVRAVGIDHYSIGGCREPQNSMTHEILLKAGIWIVEDLRYPPDVFALPQPLKFWSLPVHFRGFTGSFCRPVVVVE